MRQTVTLPKLGDAVEEVIVIEIHVAIGDSVIENQSLLLVETDKVTVEVPSPMTGTVAAIHVELDAEVATGSPIVTLEV